MRLSSYSDKGRRSCWSQVAPPGGRNGRLLQALRKHSRSQHSCSRPFYAACCARKVELAGGDGGGVSGGSGDGRGGGGDSGSSDSSDNEEDDALIGLDEAQSIAKAAGCDLPHQLQQAAQQGGVKRGLVHAYTALQGTCFVSWLARSLPWVRDRLLYDQRFLFKVGVEMIIDAGCATFAEVRKRGADFWDEFELYFCDLIVGTVMNTAVVALMAPAAVLGRPQPKTASRLQHLTAGIPSACFEKSVPGVRTYSAGARVACLITKFFEYSLIGIAGGLVGQTLATGAMTLRRSLDPQDAYTVTPPPIVDTALVWGFFMGVSSNLRYQLVFGIERLVDGTIAKRVPQVAYATTIAVRFYNNVVGGENFIDLARYFGVQ